MLAKTKTGTSPVPCCPQRLLRRPRQRFLFLFFLFISYFHWTSSLETDAAAVDGGDRSFDSVFSIPDQQAFIGKLFYYQIEIPDNVKNLTLTQAGSDRSELPDWLYFDPSTGLLFGAPADKHIYFIQVEAMIDQRKFEDIFVIEIADRPAFILNNAFLNKWNDLDASSTRQSNGNHHFYQCRIDLKRNFRNVKQIYETIVVGVYRSYYLQSDQTLQNEQTLKNWLSQFDVQTAFDENATKEFQLYYEVKECETEGSSSDANLHLDGNSQLLLKQLNRLKIENELIKISHLDDGRYAAAANNRIDPSLPLNLPSVSSSSSSSFDSNEHDNHHHHLHHHHHHKRNHHRRRNAYADDDYATPALNKDWSSLLTTSTIDYSLNHLDHHHALSRTAIPSMISPTFTGGLATTATAAAAAPPESPPTEPAIIRHHNYPSYTQLYRTPVLVPEMPMPSRNNDDQQPLFTPVFTTPSGQPSPTAAATVEPTRPSETPTHSSIAAQDNILGKMGPAGENATATTSTTTTTTTTTEHSTTILNHRPFVNKRISKLSITAGKFWQFTIPEDTFYDKEDGNTRQLRLGFFMDSELLPPDYWIQFDNENQYLYALPTEDDIGRHRFNLVAVDLQGGEATETIEIYVRQSRQSLSFTHKFLLANITWDNDRYPERIQAVSTILQRMAVQVFEEIPSGSLNEVVQRQAILRHINVLNIQQNPQSFLWSITWTNDSLRRHPCPVDEINFLFSRLYDITYPKDDHGFMAPSTELRSALAPDFSIQRVKRLFIGRSACGSYATSSDSSLSRHKDKIEFRNRLNRIGPYRLGSPFKFQIPKDTVYSRARQVDTRQLALSLAPLEPELDLPDFIYFDTHEQTIYGLPYKPEHVKTHELKLIAEDTIHGGSEHDSFTLDVEHDVNTREDYLFEVTMSFLYRNVELTSRSQQRLTSKDFYQVAHLISTRLMGNSNLDAFRMLNISRHRFTKIAEHMEQPSYNNLMENYEVNSNSLPTMEPTSELLKQQNKRHANHNHHRQHHPHHHHPHHHERNLLRQIRSISMQSDYFYEFIWTNRTLVTSYSHSLSAHGEGTFFETKTCPKDVITRDIYGRIFPRSAEEFLANVNLKENITSTDVMEIYDQVFDPLEANLEFLSVEWQPKSVCSNNAGLASRIMGAKPIRETSADRSDEEEDRADLDESVAASATETPPVLVTDEIEVDEYPSMFFGDRLLAMLIPPIAILIALLFAVTIGCCFHRANQRRKAIGTAPAYHDESPSLSRRRIPIQLEFERGVRGVHPSEQESMLDSKFGRHPVQIMPPKLRTGGGAGTNLPAAAATVAASHHHHHGHPRHANLPYQMLPQQ